MENAFSFALPIFYRGFLSFPRIKGGHIFVSRRGFLPKDEGKKDLPWGFNNGLTK
jgi:hypothetical protein